ncbi:hypothetical protein HDU98_008162 [Podochytrium sp. JEL0797]|nr:hypothetical protein HDU98_008162 [Podochytrium sp. JEL0797]
MNVSMHFKPHLAVVAKTPWLATFAAGFILGNEWLVVAAAAEAADKPDLISKSSTFGIRPTTAGNPGSASATEPIKRWFSKIYKPIGATSDPATTAKTTRTRKVYDSNGQFTLAEPLLHSREEHHEKLSTTVKDVVRDDDHLWTLAPKEAALYTRFVTFEWPDVVNLNERTRNELCNFSEKESTANNFAMDYKHPYNNYYNIEAKFASMPKSMDLKVTMKAAHGANAKTPTFVMATTTLELPVTKTGNYCHIFPLSCKEDMCIEYQVRVHECVELKDNQRIAPLVVSMMVLKIVSHYGPMRIYLSPPKIMPWYCFW